MEKICYIMGAGESGRPFEPRDGDLVIAADGGLACLQEWGIKPDYILGDFDSLEGGRPEGANVLTYPVEKDDTDTMLAVKLGMEKGYTAFKLYGSMGGRTDHTLANIQTLCYLAERGCFGELVGKRESVVAVKDGSLAFESCGEGTLSVFSAVAESRGVYERGVKYEVENAALRYDFPLGVSNAFREKEAKIGVKEGTLIVLYEHKDGKNRLTESHTAK